MGVSTRRELLPQLDARVLLHAGPPVTGAVPARLLYAAAQALVFEGMADGFEDALRLVEAGAVTLLPAQDHGVVTPLAQVVSASMPLLAVRCGGVQRQTVLGMLGSSALCIRTLPDTSRLRPHPWPRLPVRA